MEPTVLVGGAIMLLMMLGGGKKGGKHGPLGKGDEPTPLPDGHKKGGSDGLPDGTKKGHLPKGKGYAPPADMTTTDIWVSPDCQAYIVGEDWYPTVGGVDAYDWYRDIGGARDYSEVGAEAAGLYSDKTGEWEPWNGELFPDHQSTADLFAVLVMQEISPLCAETIPRFDQFDYYDEWDAAFKRWLTQFPALGELVIFIEEQAAFFGPLRSVQNREGEVGEVEANFANADWDWWMSGIDFTPGPPLPDNAIEYAGWYYTLAHAGGNDWDTNIWDNNGAHVQGGKLTANPFGPLSSQERAYILMSAKIEELQGA